MPRPGPREDEGHQEFIGRLNTVLGGFQHLASTIHRRSETADILEGNKKAQLLLKSALRSAVRAKAAIDRFILQIGPVDQLDNPVEDLCDLEYELDVLIAKYRLIDSEYSAEGDESSERRKSLLKSDDDALRRFDLKWRKREGGAASSKLLIPPGHTYFSWISPLCNDEPPCGHTKTSWPISLSPYGALRRIILRIRATEEDNHFQRRLLSDQVL